MKISRNASIKVAAEFRRGAWFFAVMALFLFSYAGAYGMALLTGVGFWGTFRLAAWAIERAGREDKK